MKETFKNRSKDYARVTPCDGSINNDTKYQKAKNCDTEVVIIDQPDGLTWHYIIPQGHFQALNFNPSITGYKSRDLAQSVAECLFPYATIKHR